MSEPREFRQGRFTRLPGATEILLVRHGESQAHVEGELLPMLDGQGDPALHPEGVVQAEQTAHRLATTGEPISAIYVTTLRRTHQTAAPLAQRLGIEPIVEPDLREVFLGEWEGGVFRQQLADGHPIGQRVMAEGRWDLIPGAEPGHEFEARVRRGISSIAGRHPDQTVVAVVHGGVIGMALTIATGARGFAFIGADNASITHLVVLGDHWIVRCFNDTSHLHPTFTRSA
ncbi:MAG: histidine phosphatase family protein [Ilumatobacteraceae bacterium]|jgi:probable phosphoglycerate mutase|nr:histidine phosphatase family protein [Ilumatobacteraceae bacterium]